MSRFLQIAPSGECLRLAAAGDRGAQRKVYEESAGPVFGLIRRMVGSRAAAEDVFQDCMVGLLANLSQFRGDAPFGAWVRQIALRHCLMHLRSPWQRARRTLDVAVPDAADGFEPLLAERIDLERALARLPELARAIVWLHDVEGISHEEIAALFGRSISFSKSRLSRAHAQLREQLVDHRASQPAVSGTGIVAPRTLP